MHTKQPFCLPANLSMDPGIPMNPPSWRWLPACSAPLSSLRPVDHPRLSYRHAWMDENAEVQSSGFCDGQEATRESRNFACDFPRQSFRDHNRDLRFCVILL
ncbi:hypothetical protein X777_05372 [Ooceraea biroi]|uniref:Uncharacterized protein n=1 Tax=Ooceraea biroi TaxID=2015173 RepID=A0A026WID8_OOCBI|nr:hypothetical protein X777_05372 [Ooceraea biroi]